MRCELLVTKVSVETGLSWLIKIKLWLIDKLTHSLLDYKLPVGDNPPLSNSQIVSSMLLQTASVQETKLLLGMYKQRLRVVTLIAFPTALI